MMLAMAGMLTSAAAVPGIAGLPAAQAMAADTLIAENAPDVIKNGDFKDADTSMWSEMLGKSKITSETGDTAIEGDLKTYGKIDRDQKESGTYESFAQDITSQVKDYNGAVYSYVFYAKLSDDYKNAPEDQRKVEFAPVVTAGGETSYLGSYSNEITGTASQTLEVGKWTKFEGTFKLEWKGALEKVLVRVIEQGTNYGNGDCVKGDYYLAGFKMVRTETPKKEIEKDVPQLKSAMATADGLGTDAIIGTALTSDEVTDETLMELVGKHFNALTLGNELKLDCMLGYNNAAFPKGSIRQAEINGKKIDVPTLDHSRADKMLDVILAWNKAHPQDKLRVRGHVLVWHSQSPEWFFHEGYDKTKPYVSKEEMNLRLEWYIKTMLTYYTGANSKYKDLFYGWDVVNEAVVGENYRTDTEAGSDTLQDDTHGNKSSWWHVYGSNEFIINAFTYANKYAPASLELYYNDYGECDSKKMVGISKLLSDVKAKEGPAGTGTRISGMGMQGHYNLESPTAAQLETAVRTYAKIVGKVQLTELDFTASNDFDGTDATRQQEYVKQAYKYKEVYDTLKKLDKEDGIDVSGFTVWGMLDGHSWLQTQANVGGGTDGKRVQCPLLFDDDYKVKPSYWALVDPSKLEPFINTVTIVQSEDGSFTYGKKYAIEGDGVKASFVPIWNSKGVAVQVDVEDATEDASDAVTVYLERNGKKEKVSVARSAATKTEKGYQAQVSFDAADVKMADTIKLDVLVVSGDKKAAYNDLKFTQEESTKYFANVLVKPFAQVSKGTVKVDGTEDAAWKSAAEMPLQISLGAKASATAKALWDEENLYVLVQVQDSVLNADNANAWEQDSVEIFVDENNAKSDGYEADDKQYRVSYKNVQSFNGEKCKAENIQSAAKTTKDGYVVEAALKWTDLKPAEGGQVGLEFQVNDADASGKRIGTLSWFDASGNGWASPGVFGTVALTGAKEGAAAADTTDTTDTTGKTDEAGTADDTAGKTEETTKLAKAKGVKATKVKATSAKITWKAVKGAKKYQVSYQVGKAKAKTVTTKKTAVNLKKLKKNTTVKVKVRAISGSTKGAYTKVVSFKTKKK